MGWDRVRVVLKKILISAGLLLFICEYLIYPVVLFKCSWPEEDLIPIKDEENKTLRAMFLADTHLLGPFRGHWFDKLRREWQMRRAFQTAMSFFKPEVVFFLGDVFDEGNWVNEDDFQRYVLRFQDIFSVKGNGKTRSLVISGNHDMGFHYEIFPYLHNRFNRAFNTSSVRLVNIKGSQFVLLNSMAMEMDGCFLCDEAIRSLLRISQKLRCREDPKSCGKDETRPGAVYSPPILLQHFPMYRKSDESCTGEDTAPAEEKNTKFRESMDCLSKESSALLLKLVNPRLIMSGHTHHHCIVQHTFLRWNNFTTQTIPEYSVPSFNWRNRNDPSFYLGIITPTQIHLSKCYLPKETTVYFLYTIGGIFLPVWILLSSNMGFYIYWNLWWRRVRARIGRLLGRREYRDH